MIGVVLVTHSKLASEFCLALEHVVGKQDQIEAINIAAEDNMEKRRAEVIAAVDKVNDGMVWLS